MKPYYKATVIKTLWYWCKNKQIDKWNRTELRNRAHKYSQLIFTKGAKATQWRKDSLYNNGAGIRYPQTNKMYLPTNHTLVTKINSKSPGR